MAVQYQPISDQNSNEAIAGGDLVPTLRPAAAANPVPLPQSVDDLAAYVQPFELRRLAVDGYTVLADGLTPQGPGRIALLNENEANGTGQVQLYAASAADLAKLRNTAFSAGHQIEFISGATTWSIVVTLSIDINAPNATYLINYADADEAWPFNAGDVVNLRGASPHIPWTSMVQVVRALAAASRLAVPSERAVRQALLDMAADLSRSTWTGNWGPTGDINNDAAALNSTYDSRNALRGTLGQGSITASTVKYLRFNVVSLVGAQDGPNLGADLAAIHAGGVVRLADQAGGVFHYRLTGAPEPRESDGSAPEAGDAVTAYDLPVDLVSPDGTIEGDDDVTVTVNPRREIIAEQDVVRETPVVGTLTDGADIAWAVDELPNARVTLAGNRTMSAPSGAVDGAYYLLTVKQDGTGGRTLAWNAAYVFDAAQNTIDAAASKRTKFAFVYEDGKMRCLGAVRGF